VSAYAMWRKILKTFCILKWIKPSLAFLLLLELQAAQWASHRERASMQRRSEPARGEGPRLFPRSSSTLSSVSAPAPLLLRLRHKGTFFHWFLAWRRDPWLRPGSSDLLLQVTDPCCGWWGSQRLYRRDVLSDTDSLDLKMSLRF
jgi:hypothetical protein